METFLPILDRIIGISEKILKAAIIALIGFLMLWVCALVPARYFFSYTPAYGEELSRYVFVWLVFLCMPILAKTGGHMAIETITSRLKGAKLKFFRIVADIFTFVFLIIMIYQGCFMVSRASFQTTPGLGLTMSYVYLVIPVGCGFMLLYVLYSFLTLLRTPAESVK